MSNPKKTGKKLSELASEKLRDPDASKIQKQLAGSALSQASTDKQPSKELEAKAAQVLASEKYNADTKALAASVLSQSDPTN